MKSIGIDAIYVYTSELYVDNYDLAKARNIDPNHFIKGIGIKTFSVKPPNEDYVSQAATAAYRLMKYYGYRPEDFFRIDVATESSLEGSRATVSDVIGMLEQVYGKGSFSHILGYEQKFACASGVERILESSIWHVADYNPRKYSMVIVSDTAKYNLQTGEEPTQGGAAVAFVISENPKIADIIPKGFAGSMRYEPGDFRKPDGRTVAIVDGRQSIASYLNEMKIAWLLYKKQLKKLNLFKLEKDETILDYISKAIYHNPNMKMVRDAHTSLLLHEWRNLTRFNNIVKDIGEQPKRGNLDDLSFYQTKEYNDYRRKFIKTNDFIDDFDNRIGSSLIAPSYIGNSYSASFGVGLASMIENDKENLSNSFALIGGYGSGSKSIIITIKFLDHYKHESRYLDTMNQIKNRIKLNIDEYQDIHSDKINLESYTKILSKPRFILTSIGKNENEGIRYYSISE